MFRDVYSGDNTIEKHKEILSKSGCDQAGTFEGFLFLDLTGGYKRFAVRVPFLFCVTLCVCFILQQKRL